MSRRYAAKVDSNQTEIVEALRGIGASVCVTSAVGQGFPDLTVGFRGSTFLIELKTPTGKMTKDQMCFIESWRGHYSIVRSVEQAIDAITNPQAVMQW